MQHVQHNLTKQYHSLYFKDYETGQKRKQCDEVDLDEHNAK